MFLICTVFSCSKESPQPVPEPPIDKVVNMVYKGKCYYYHSYVITDSTGVNVQVGGVDTTNCSVTVHRHHMELDLSDRTITASPGPGFKEYSYVFGHSFPEYNVYGIATPGVPDGGFLDFVTQDSIYFVAQLSLSPVGYDYVVFKGKR